MSSPINPFLDLQTLMTQFSVPGVDLASVIESRRKDIDALVAANQAAVEAAQALARKQTEMLTQAMVDIQQAARDAASGVGLGDPSKQAANARKAIEKAIADMKELAEMAQHSQREALTHLTQRADEHLQEIRGLMTPPKAAGRK